ncbi:MAG: hypothetical protein M0R03_16860, partial [Novosphingobium sp.]|nr:hypothetical protein [Novosphingobium sp.]
MKGNKQAATQTQIQDVPGWAKPYYTDLISKSKAISEEGYVPYGGQRLTGDSGDLTSAQDMVRNIAGQGIPGMADAQAAMGGLGALAGNLGQQDPSQFAQTQVNQYQFDPTRQFTGAEVEQYMSPYMDTVVQRQQDDAYEQYLRGQGMRNQQAVSAGAFGGSRQAVQEGIAGESLSRQLGDIQAQGLQSAYESAQQQFERDRAASMSMDQRRADELARVQGIGVDENARVQGAQADEAMRQREFQLQTMGFSADMAREVAALGERARAGDVQAAQLLEAQGLGEMAREQAGL